MHMGTFEAENRFFHRHAGQVIVHHQIVKSVADKKFSYNLCTQFYKQLSHWLVRRLVANYDKNATYGNWPCSSFQRHRPGRQSP